MQVKASDNIKDLTGIGLEYLVDTTGEYVRAVFYNGMFRGIASKVSAEIAAECTVTMPEAA